MQSNKFDLRGVFAALAVTILAACGSAATLGGPSGPSADAGKRGSWMTVEAKKQALVYVSSVLTGDVYVYSYATQQLEGTLTGFQTPYGLCSDKKGDVWIVNDGASDLVEYAHGGTTPLQTLGDSGEYPEGCAVDPKTGNLAVTNFSGKTGNGDVAIYAGAKGSPQTYADPGIANYRFCGYDDAGNLFVDGASSSAAFILAELPKGGSTFTGIPVQQKIGWPGGVQWDGKHVAVGDTDAAVIYEIDAASGKTAGTTQLSGADYVNQFWIAGAVARHKAARKTAVLAPSQDGNAGLGLYKYPAGGPAVWTIGVQEPFGTTLSD